MEGGGGRGGRGGGSDPSGVSCGEVRGGEPKGVCDAVGLARGYEYTWKGEKKTWWRGRAVGLRCGGRSMRAFPLFSFCPFFFFVEGCSGHWEQDRGRGFQPRGGVLFTTWPWAYSLPIFGGGFFRVLACADRMRGLGFFCNFLFFFFSRVFCRGVNSFVRGSVSFFYSIADVIVINVP